MAKKKQTNNNHAHNNGRKNSNGNGGTPRGRNISPTAQSIKVSIAATNDQTPTDPDAFKASTITTAVLGSFKIKEQHDAAAVAEATNVVKTVDTSTVRKDLTHIPFVTIDGITSRDFDDAVHAEPDTAADNVGGYLVNVAIADVAWYVRPGSALDDQALSRGFSVYPPDRAVHMLPNELSEQACSLKPDVDRYALVAHIRVNKDGDVLDSSYSRAIIRSRARLTYEGVDEFLGGNLNGVPAVAHTLVPPLHDVYEILNQNAMIRGKLKFSFGKMSSTIGADGFVNGFAKDDNREGSRELIEELMCLANCVVARDLLAHGQYPVMTRVHEEPAEDQVTKAKALLSAAGITKRHGEEWTLADINKMLDDPAYADKHDKIRSAAMKLINRGEYAINETGHFGLALKTYCHFTSPIRRYPDLQVHRALISAFNLGEGGMAKDVDLKSMFNQAAAINALDNQADAVYRIATDRYALAFLYKTGPVHQAKLKDIKKDGALVLAFENTPLKLTVDKSFVPADDFRINMKKRQLVDDMGTVIGINDNVPVRIVSCNPLTGTFSIAMDGYTYPKGGTLQPMAQKDRKQAPKNG